MVFASLDKFIAYYITEKTILQEKILKNAKCLHFVNIISCKD